MASISYDEAAHLLRRMGFGGAPSEIDALVPLGREGAVDHLLNYRGTDNSPLESLLAASFDFSNPFDPARFNTSEIQRWWITRMAYSLRPFEEKMTLFWHNHFATSATKVEADLMYIQNRMLRKKGLDKFEDLLLSVAQDPAMLVWLDGVSNIKDTPNENFARELQELFSMGINDVVTGTANYTEQDVKEIARAFTGWRFSPPRSILDPFTREFVIVPEEHDNRVKTVYGQTANFSGDEIIEIIAARRSTARYLVKKLFEFFCYPLDPALPADVATIEKFADVYFAQQHSIKRLVRAIFTSDEFFSPRARFAIVKSPLEFVVGAVRMLGARYTPGTYSKGSNILTAFSIFLGQEPFNPPDVAGWRLNMGWINTSTLLNRFTFADFLVINRPANPDEPGLSITHQQMKSLTKKTAEKTVDKLLSTLGPLEVDAETRQSLINYLETDENGNHVPFRRNSLSIDNKSRGLVHLIMCLAEFQMN